MLYIAFDCIMVHMCFSAYTKSIKVTCMFQNMYVLKTCMFQNMYVLNIYVQNIYVLKVTCIFQNMYVLSLKHVCFKHLCSKHVCFKHLCSKHVCLKKWLLTNGMLKACMFNNIIVANFCIFLCIRCNYKNVHGYECAYMFGFWKNVDGYACAYMSNF